MTRVCVLFFTDQPFCKTADKTNMIIRTLVSQHKTAATKTTDRTESHCKIVKVLIYSGMIRCADEHCRMSQHSILYFFQHLLKHKNEL